MSRPAAPSSPQLLVFGLDGGCLPVLRPLCAADVTPTIGSIFTDGTVAPLESQVVPWTASAWPTLVTGQNPGRHGVFDFLRFDGYDWAVVNFSNVRERTVWELLDEHGYSSVVLNVPVTHPPRPVDGAIVPGLTAPENPPCHPPDILAAIEDACGDYRVYPQSEASIADRSAYEETVAQRGAAFRYLCDRFDPDFAFCQFQVTDSVFHEHDGARSAVETVYGAVDAEIERILDAVDPENVLVVSDHGIGPVTGYEFAVNEFLADAGFLKRTRGGEGMPTWSRAWEHHLLEGREESGHDVSPIERTVASAAKFGITTQRVGALLDRLGLAEVVGRHVPNDAVRAGSEQVDFAASQAYVRSKSELGVRINLEGREPRGQVAPDEYETVRSSLIAALESVRTPDGEPVFEAVIPRETVFEGPHVDDAPDIVTVPTAFNNAIVAELGREQFSRPREPWNHKRMGVLAARGRDFDRSASIESPTIYDVTPTICSLFDVPADETMTGNSLAVVGDGERQSYPPIEVEPMEPTRDETVEARLSDLGYR